MSFVSVAIPSPSVWFPYTDIFPFPVILNFPIEYTQASYSLEPPSDSLFSVPSTMFITSSPVPMFAIAAVVSFSIVTPFRFSVTAPFVFISTQFSKVPVSVYSLSFVIVMFVSYLLRFMFDSVTSCPLSTSSALVSFSVEFKCV